MPALNASAAPISLRSRRVGLLGCDIRFMGSDEGDALRIRESLLGAEVTHSLHDEGHRTLAGHRYIQGR